mgnify:CR=1 FL=1
MRQTGTAGNYLPLRSAALPVMGSAALYFDEKMYQERKKFIQPGFYNQHRVEFNYINYLRFFQKRYKFTNFPMEKQEKTLQYVTKNIKLPFYDKISQTDNVRFGIFFLSNYLPIGVEDEANPEQPSLERMS